MANGGVGQQKPLQRKCLKTYVGVKQFFAIATRKAFPMLCGDLICLTCGAIKPQIDTIDPCPKSVFSFGCNTNAKVACFRVNTGFSLANMMRRSWGINQIVQSIIRSIAITVPDFVFGPRSVTKRPCNSMREQGLIVNTYDNKPVAPFGSGQIARSYPPTPINSVIKKPSLRVVIQQLAKPIKCRKCPFRIIRFFFHSLSRFFGLALTKRLGRGIWPEWFLLLTAPTHPGSCCKAIRAF